MVTSALIIHIGVAMSAHTLPTLSIHIRAASKTERSRAWLRLIAPVALLFILAAWQLFIPESGPTSLILPRPSAILARFSQIIANGTLPRELAVTTFEIAAGLLLGVGSAFGIGYSIAHSRMLEQVIGPYLVGFQALPIVAIAPALILWLGPGLASNALICAFIVFFPMLMSTVLGIKQIDPEQRALMHAFAATRWQVFTKLELPAALPALISGLKISAILAVAGAVVAEGVTPLGGLGSLLYAARSRYDSALAFACVFTLTAFALALYSTVNALDRRVSRWKALR